MAHPAEFPVAQVPTGDQDAAPTALSLLEVLKAVVLDPLSYVPPV